MSSESIKIHYFARCRVLAGLPSEEFLLQDPIRVSSLVAEIVRIHPQLSQMFPTTRIAVNCEFSSDDSWVHPGDEVALIPPVSGGLDDFCRLSEKPIEPGEAVRILPKFEGRDGGLATFAGVVRNHSVGKDVARLEYEAYPAMALKKMRQIAGEARELWDVTHVAIVHRVGTLDVGETAVSIAVTAPHRRPALEACSHVIERLKEDVPIWKCEVAPSGERWWGKGP